MRRKIGVLLLFFLIIIIIGGSFSNFSIGSNPIFKHRTEIYVEKTNEVKTYNYKDIIISKAGKGYSIDSILRLPGGQAGATKYDGNRVRFPGMGNYQIRLILKKGNNLKYIDSVVTVKMKYTVKKGSKSVYPTVGKYTTYDVPKYIKERI